MTTTGYLILISALALVAGVMLYAKFASLHRKKQNILEEREANDDVDFTPSVISSAETETLAFEDAEVEMEFEDQVSEDVHPIEVAIESATHSVVHVDSVESSGEEEEKNAPAEEYYDDLQEAAAGLAMLMRSSSSAGGNPNHRFVVEPEENQESEAGVQEEISSTVIPPVETAQIRVDSVENTELEEVVIAADVAPAEEMADDFEEERWESEICAEETLESVTVSGEQDSDSALVDSGDSVQLAAEEPSHSFVAVLGEEVSGRIEKIDSDLDALEELVASIEASLASFTPLTDEDPALESREEQGGAVSEAA